MTQPFNKVIPITILTGFLGAGKTTLVNKIIEQNKGIKFGLIINEFGEEGIDGALIETNSEEEIIEISNGCLCCIARGDLLKSAENLINTGQIDYILIECSGLAEPMPIAQTFAMDDLDGRIVLDSIICLVDAENHTYTKDNYRIAIEQVIAADIILFNKIDSGHPTSLKLQRTRGLSLRPIQSLSQLKIQISQVNPQAFFLENDENFDTKILIDTGKWSYEKVIDQNINEGSDHEDHHEHEEIDEFVYVTEKQFDLEKFQDFVLNNFPKNIVRSKGFLRFDNENYPIFLFQMAGAKKTLLPFKTKRENFNAKKSRIVFIGKNLDKDLIKEKLEQVIRN
jgi:G3E family GTPase